MTKVASSRDRATHRSWEVGGTAGQVGETAGQVGGTAGQVGETAGQVGGVAVPVGGVAPGAARLAPGAAQVTAPIAQVTAPIAQGPSPFVGLVLALRWVTLCGALAWTEATTRSPTGIVVGGALVLFAIWRTVHPRSEGKRLQHPHSGVVGRIGSPAPWDEMAVAIVAVMLTGGWSSPFVVVLVSPIAAAGLLVGWAASAAMLATAMAGVGAAELIGLAGPGGVGSPAGVSGSSQWRLGLSWCFELGLLGIVGAYSRRLSSAADAQHHETVSHLEALARANELLVELHQINGTIPATLTVAQAVEAAQTRLVELTAPDLTMVLLRGPSQGTWTVAAATGDCPGPVLTDAELPAPMRHCLAGEPTMRNRRGHSLSVSTRSAVYAPLLVGERCLGLVALEWNRPGDRYRECELVRSVAIQCAITLDNVRLVAALRSAGADDERHRIAEQLHDDVGQDLAVLALTMDRVWNRISSQSADESRMQIDEMRQEARRILGHVRETLADLRSNVTEEHSLAEVLQGFLTRVAARSNTAVSLDSVEGRLPLAEEREVWRIAQQAILDAERQAKAGLIAVRWRPTPGPAVLEVRYDGLDPEEEESAGGTANLADGLVAMNERAALIGARLELETGPEHETVVRCCLA